MKVRKLITLLVVLVLVGSFGASAAAAQGPQPPATTGFDPNRSQEIEYQHLFEHYGIVTVERAPEGIAPIVIKSPAQLRKLIKELRSSKRVDVSDRMCIDRVVNEGVLSGRAANGVSYYSVRRECTQNTGASTFHTWADIHIGVYGSSYAWIDSVNEWVGLTGITLGQDLTNTYHYHYVTATTADITGGGTVNVYLLIDGVIRVYSQPVECSIHYSLY